MTYSIRETSTVTLLQDMRVTTSSRFLAMYVWGPGGAARTRSTRGMFEAATLPFLAVAPVSECGADGVRGAVNCCGHDPPGPGNPPTPGIL